MSELNGIGPKNPIGRANARSVPDLPPEPGARIGGDRLRLSSRPAATPPPPEASERRDEGYCNWVTEVKNTPTGETEVTPAPPPPVYMPNDKNAGRDLPESFFAAHPNLRELKGVLRVENLDDPTVQQHVADLAKFPAPLLQRLRKAGLADVHIAARSVPYLDSNEALQNERPRGWPEGSTWNQVAGIFNPEARAVSAGKAEVKDGASSLVQHELGHAIGGLLGYDNDRRVVAHYDRLFEATVPHPCNPNVQLPKLLPYLRQTQADGNRFPGRQEFVAESIAVYLTEGRDVAIAEFDRPYVDFLEREVLGIKR